MESPEPDITWIRGEGTLRGARSPNYTIMRNDEPEPEPEPEPQPQPQPQPEPEPEPEAPEPDLADPDPEPDSGGRRAVHLTSSPIRRTSSPAPSTPPARGDRLSLSPMPTPSSRWGTSPVASPDASRVTFDDEPSARQVVVYRDTPSAALLDSSRDHSTDWDASSRLVGGALSSSQVARVSPRGSGRLQRYSAGGWGEDEELTRDRLRRRRRRARRRERGGAEARERRRRRRQRSDAWHDSCWSSEGWGCALLLMGAAVPALYARTRAVA